MRPVRVSAGWADTAAVTVGEERGAGHGGGRSETPEKGGVVGTPIVWMLILLAMGVAGTAAGEEDEPAIMAPLASRSLLLDVAGSGDRLVAVGERGHILLSTDQGASWRQVPVPTQALLTAVTLGNGGSAWAVGHDSVILRSTDGGETWEVVYRDPEANQPLFDVFFLDDQRGFAVGAYGVFLESGDGGATWEPRIIFDGDNHLHHVARFPSGALLIVGERGLILRSDDQGANWRELPSPYHGSLFGSLPVDDRVLLVFGLRGHAFRSADGGTTWQEVVTHTTAMLTDACSFADGRILISGLGGVLLGSGDQGRGFAIEEDRTRLGLSAVVCLADGSAVLVGELGVQRVPAAELGALFAGGRR